MDIVRKVKMIQKFLNIT